MSKVAINVERFDDIRAGDSVCGMNVLMTASGSPMAKVQSCKGDYHWYIPALILNALCKSGHVTREVDAADALEWNYGDSLHYAIFLGENVGVVSVDRNWGHYFKVYDPDFTLAIEAKFKELKKEMDNVQR